MSNIEKGLSLCAENYKGANVRSGIGGSAVRMVGIKSSHNLKKADSKAEYFHNVEGTIRTFVELEKLDKNSMKISSHGLFGTNAFEKWAVGSIDSCHGYLGKK